MVRCIASIDTSFFVIQPTSLRNLPSLAFATMKVSPLSYQSATLNATISRHSSPSYILRELIGFPCLPIGYRDLTICRDFESQELTYEQWKSVLHLSTRWGFASLRKLALKSIKPPTWHDQLVLARTYSVEEWVLPALTALCSRSLPLSLDEARQMDIEDVILVASVREEIRDGALRVDVADIPHCVEAAQAGKVKAKADAWVKCDGDAMAKAEVWERANQEAMGKQKAENERLEAEAKAETEAGMVEKEARKSAEAEKWLCQKQAGAQIAKQRAADKVTTSVATSDLASSSAPHWPGLFAITKPPTESSNPPPLFGSRGQNPWAKRAARGSVSDSKPATPASRPAGGMGM